MNSRLNIICTLPVLLFCLTACESTGPSEKQRENLLKRQQYELMRSQDERIGQLAQRIKNLEDSNAQIMIEMNSLRQEIQSGNRSRTNYDQEINLLRQMIATEKQERQTSMNAMINQVGTEISKAVKYLAPPPPADTGTGPLGSGKFVEYKVQKGATLNAIAQAYGVTAAAIKKANRMKNDTIIEGQILYIPKQ